MSRLKSAAVKDIDIDIADILGQKYRHRIDIGHGDIDPPLACTAHSAIQAIRCYNTLHNCVEGIKKHQH